MADRAEFVPWARRWRTPIRLAASVLPLLTCAILSTIRDSASAATAVLVLVVWVVAAAASGDRVPGLLAAVSGGAWFDFFLTEPYQRFTTADSDDIEATVLLILISVGVTEIALWGHRQHARAARRYLDGVLGTAEIVSQGDTPASTLVDVVARQIVNVLGADSCRFVEGPVHDSRTARLDHHGVVTRGDHTVDVDRLGLPHDEYIALLVRRDSEWSATSWSPLPAKSPIPVGNSAGSRCSWRTKSRWPLIPADRVPGSVSGGCAAKRRYVRSCDGRGCRRLGPC